MDVVFWTIVNINCHCIYDGFTKYVTKIKNQLTKSQFSTKLLGYPIFFRCVYCWNCTSKHQSYFGQCSRICNECRSICHLDLAVLLVIQNNCIYCCSASKSLFDHVLFSAWNTLLVNRWDICFMKLCQSFENPSYRTWLRTWSCQVTTILSSLCWSGRHI